MSVKNINRNVSYALNQPLVDVPAFPIPAKRAPTTNDFAPLGQIWLFGASVYILAEIVANVATWVSISGGSGSFSSLTVNPGPTALTGQFTVTAGTHAVNIGADAADHAVNIGSSTGVSAMNLDYGTGGITINGAASGHVDIAASATTGTISIGGLAQTGFIEIGTSTAGQIIDIANANNTAPQSVLIADGNYAANSTVNILNGIGSAGTATFDVLSNSGQTQNAVINIGRGGSVGGGANAIVVGSTSGASSLALAAGTAGISLNSAGQVSVGVASQTAASPTASVIINARVGYANFTGFTTAAAGSQVFTIDNSTVTADSAILVSVDNKGANDAKMTLSRVLKSANTFDVTVINNGAAALNGDVNITFWVLD